MTTTRGSTWRIDAPRNADHVTVWLSEALATARKAGATDLHFFPAPEHASLWLRIDSVLHEAARYSPAIHDRIVARLKVLARCPDYVREAMTEGRFSIAAQNGTGRAEARLSVIPSLTGEKAVLRLLSEGASVPGLGELGFSAKLEAALVEAGSRPQGLLLVVGPAGSGKSTTLAALLSRLSAEAGRPMAFLTLEDPPEIPLPFATQMAVDASRGVTFASGLRALLRQDPEVIMVGEIRDAETAQVAANAALTGHRLFSTLHTLNTAEALVRLTDMGVAPYLLASALGGVLSQRLVRRACSGCWRDEDSDPAGCDECHGIGYRGRFAIGEWTTIGPEATELLMQRRPASELQRAVLRRVTWESEADSSIQDKRTTRLEINRMARIGAPGGERQ